MKSLKAIYRVVPTDKAVEQDTLIYNMGDGFTWVRLKDETVENTWHCFAMTAPEAERKAIEAGFEPVAIAYIEKNRAFLTKKV